jgi:hypothetical protein
MRSLQYPTILSPIGFLAAIDFMWDALFSPFGGIQRITSMSELAVVVTCMAASARVMTREKSVSGGI